MAIFSLYPMASMPLPPVFVRIASLLAALAYAYYIIWPTWQVPQMAYHIADGMMALALVACLTERRQQLGTRVAICAALAWLVADYLRGMSSSRSKWVGYDGFALAALIAGQHDFSL